MNEDLNYDNEMRVKRMEKRLDQFVEMREELEHAASDRHVLYRDYVTTFEHGHRGSFIDCPSYECIKARQALGVQS